MTVCPLCGEHKLSLTLFEGMFVAPCPTLPTSTMRVFTGSGRPLVLESSRNQ